MQNVCNPFLFFPTILDNLIRDLHQRKFIAITHFPPIFLLRATIYTTVYSSSKVGLHIVGRGWPFLIKSFCYNLIL